MKSRTRIEETADEDGWRIAHVPIGKTVWHAAAELLRLGAEAEVLAPAELRDKMTELTAGHGRTLPDGATWLPGSKNDRADPRHETVLKQDSRRPA